MSSIRNTGTAAHSALANFEAVNRSVGGFSNAAIRSRASDFYQRMTYGSVLEEPRLRLKMALSSTARAEMAELWKVVLHPQGTGLQNLQKLEAWMARNQNLVGFMSSDTRAMLTDMVSKKDTAAQMQGALDAATHAVKQAFGRTDGSADAALQKLGNDAQVEGSKASTYSLEMGTLLGRVSTLFTPGATEGFMELQSAIGAPDITETERQGRVRAWGQKHPRLAEVLFTTERGLEATGLLRENGRVAGWADDEYKKARDAALAALTQRPAQA